MLKLSCSYRGKIGFIISDAKASTHPPNNVNLIKVLVISSIASILLGQLAKISLQNTQAGISITDVLVSGSVSSFVLYWLFQKKRLLLPTKITFAFFLFIFAALASTVFALNSLDYLEVIVSLMFLARFVLYFSFVIVIYNIAKDHVQKWQDLLILIGLLLALIGILQLAVFPDLSPLTHLGWDPHINRVFTTYLDPNFSGAFFLIFFTVSLAKFIFSKKPRYLVFSLIFLFLLILTFSRSSYIALLASIFTIGIFKSARLALVIIVIFTAVSLVLPQVRNRIIGAFQIDKTSQARIESWQNAILIFQENPLFGVGFNTYRYVQERYGLLTDSEIDAHSASGSDSSILNIAATTGVFGLVFFILLAYQVLLAALKNIRSDQLALATTAALVGLIVHSQFVNSLLFPQLMLLIGVLIGLKLARDV